MVKLNNLKLNSIIIFIIIIIVIFIIIIIIMLFFYIFHNILNYQRYYFSRLKLLNYFIIFLLNYFLRINQYFKLN